MIGIQNSNRKVGFFAEWKMQKPVLPPHCVMDKKASNV